MYEGQDKNPEMCRVLLTHEIMCRYRFPFSNSQILARKEKEQETFKTFPKES